MMVMIVVIRVAAVVAGEELCSIGVYVMGRTDTLRNGQMLQGLS